MSRGKHQLELPPRLTTAEINSLCQASGDVDHLIRQVENAVRAPMVQLAAKLDAEINALAEERGALMRILLQQRAQAPLQTMRDQLAREIAVLNEALALKQTEGSAA